MNEARDGILLSAHNIHKTYRQGREELHVLKGVSLKIGRGKITSVVGPSGAGKSTLLHILGGLDSPDEGQVIFAGLNIYGLNDIRRSRLRNKRIGFVFQFYHLLPEFSALENVILPAVMDATSFLKAKEKAWELLKLVGLAQRTEHKPAQLSGGEQQRVAIARTLINDPDIILCDEPTGNLDSERGQEIVQLLGNLNQQKQKTLIIVSHEERIAQMAHRIVHIRDGKLV